MYPSRAGQTTDFPAFSGNYNPKYTTVRVPNTNLLPINVVKTSEGPTNPDSTMEIKRKIGPGGRAARQVICCVARLVPQRP
jgi:hypothetical protein